MLARPVSLLTKQFWTQEQRDKYEGDVPKVNTAHSGREYGQGWTRVYGG
jgi:hypothetical protein